tara:strand:+ start:3798 stop:4367 length:570 start_codon:yes stop_codon:yes gene_type:complete
MVKKYTCVFISGQGTNLNNLIKKSRDYSFPIKIKLVISNNKNASGLKFAKKNSIPILIIDTKKKNFESMTLLNLKKYKISLICLAGFMKILSKKFINLYRKKIINIHPSLLPKFKGLNTFRRVIEKNEKKTGCSVHYVNEKLDGGKIITQKSFFVNSTDNEISLRRKTQKLEYFAFPEAIIKIYRNINF